MMGEPILRRLMLSMIGNFTGRAAIDIKSYPKIDDFFDDLAKAYQEEIKALSAAGCTYIQLDDTVSHVPLELSISIP